MEGGCVYPPLSPFHSSSLTLVDDGLDDHGVLQDVLAPGLEELDAFFFGKRREEGGARASG